MKKISRQSALAPALLFLLLAMGCDNPVEPAIADFSGTWNGTQIQDGTHVFSTRWVLSQSGDVVTGDRLQVLSDGSTQLIGTISGEAGETSLTATSTSVTGGPDCVIALPMELVGDRMTGSTVGCDGTTTVDLDLQRIGGGA